MNVIASFYTVVPKAWHWGVGIKRPASVGIKIPTNHFFTVESAFRFAEAQLYITRFWNWGLKT